MMNIGDKSTILFQGDSITDCNRIESADGFGQGYVKAVYDYLKSVGSNITVINRGISGNRTTELIERYDEDFLAVKADYVSLLIGVNDVWHGYYDKEKYMPIDRFEHNLEFILDGIKNKMKSKLILLEPFLIQTGTLDVMREDLWKKTEVIRKLGRKYADLYLSLDGMFAEHIEREASYWSFDGVHPSWEGHRLIADKFLTATGLKK